MYRPLSLSGNQPAQHGFLWDMAPGETLYQSGFGGGKTWAAARKLLMLHAHNQCPGMAFAPTYPDLHRFVIPELLRVCEEWSWPHADHSSDQKNPRIEVWDWPILLLSGDTPERFAGFEVGHGWGDEAARIPRRNDDPKRSTPLQCRARLRHPDAKILHLMFTTTPEGMGTWVEDDFFAKPLPHRRRYVGSTRRNPALPASYVTDLLSAIPAELADQYLDGQAVTLMGNRAHPTFSRARHVKALPQGAPLINPSLPLHVGCDYNVSPMCWTAAQVLGEDVRVVDEVVLADFGQVDAAVHAAHDKGWGKLHVVFHPDKSAKARSTTGDPEFVAMTKAAKGLGWRCSGDCHGANPAVDARINLVSRLLLDATGRSRLTIDPRCATLIQNLERTGRATNGYDPGDEGKLGHILDALGYLCWDVAQPRGEAAWSRVTL